MCCRGFEPNPTLYAFVIESHGAGPRFSARVVSNSNERVPENRHRERAFVMPAADRGLAGAEVEGDFAEGVEDLSVGEVGGAELLRGSA